jgi:hypothetical protein
VQTHVNSGEWGAPNAQQIVRGFSQDKSSSSLDSTALMYSEAVGNHSHIRECTSRRTVFIIMYNIYALWAAMCCEVPRIWMHFWKSKLSLISGPMHSLYTA